MDFGKLKTIDGVNFALPADAPATRVVLGRGRPSEGRWLHLGAPSWARRDWMGDLYPRGAPPGSLLGWYARSLTSIELNASFYRTPEAKTLAAWRAATPAGFRFCPKLSSAITHDRGLQDVRDATTFFLARMECLGERLGPTLVQLPPTLGPDQLDRLDRFLAEWPSAQTVPFVELRHPRWWQQQAPTAPVARLLWNRKASLVVTDVAGRRDVCHATLTQAQVMVRFVGNQHPPSDHARVLAWLDRLCAWRALGLEQAFFFVHAPDDRDAPSVLRFMADAARARGVDVLAVLNHTPARSQEQRALW